MATDGPAEVTPTPDVVQTLRRGRIDALRRRMDGADDAMREALTQRIAALEAARAGHPSSSGRASARAPSTSPFAPLLDTIEREARWRDAHAIDGFPARAAYPALPALQPLRALWARLRIEGQTREALAPATTDAGPLNSASLVQRALRLMRDEAPDYLHHLMAYLDVLATLERLPATGSPQPGETAAPAKKRARATRAKRR